MAHSTKRDSIKIVIADDDATTRAALRLLLQDHLYRVVGEASDGERAVELCASLKPDVVFLDIDMPKLNGNQAAQKLRELLPDIGIVVVSALSTLENVQHALQSGAGAFVVKPFTSAKLIAAVEKSIKKNAARAARE